MDCSICLCTVGCICIRGDTSLFCICSICLCIFGWLYPTSLVCICSICLCTVGWLYHTSLVCICSICLCAVGWIYVRGGAWLNSIGLFCVYPMDLLGLCTVTAGVLYV